MSEPTGPACPECGTPRVADGSPACSCARRAAEAHRETRHAEAAAAEDFNPLRIRPFVEFGDKDPASAHAPAPEAAGAPGEPEGPEGPEGAAPAGDTEQPAAPLDPGPDSPSPGHDQPPTAGSSSPPPADAPRSRRRTVLVTGAGAAVAVLVTGGFVGGLFSYTGPSRDDSVTGGVRAGVPDGSSATSAEPAQPSSTTSVSPSSEPSTSTTPTTATTTATTPAATASPTSTPSSTTGTTAPAPTTSNGQPPVLRYGDKGPEVVELQLRLRQIGFYTGDADGDYDKDVENAVRSYQFARLIFTDESGVYGHATRAALESETSEP
ncbi:peptidoglycan-binding domain-containing protein [Streptomyces sp. 7R007]